MTDIFEAETRNTITMFVRVFVVLCTLSITMKTLIVLTSGLESLGNPLFHFLLPLLFLLYSYYLHRIKDGTLRLKQISLYLGIEIILIIYKVISYVLYEHKVLFTFFATGAVISFQTRIVASYSAVIFISLKHLYLWYIYDAIQENLSFHPFVIMGISSYLGLMLIQTKNRNEYITQNEQYSRYLNQSNQNLKNLIETLQSGLVMLNSNISLLNLNIKAKTLLHCSEQDIIAVLHDLNYRGEATCSVLDSILANQHMEINSNLSLGSICKNSRHIDLNLSKIQWSESFIFVLLLIDVTDTVELENSLIENQLKTKFLNFIPHELQTPTVGILGCAEGSLEAIRDNQLHLVYKNVELIYKSARRLHLMICNISDYAEILSGRFQLQKGNINLKETIDDAYGVLFKEAKAQNLTTTVRIDPQIPQIVETDKHRFLQLLTILLSNSLKYTYVGFIEIVAVLETDCRIRIEINDSGIGINSVKLAMIQNQLRSPRPGVLYFGLELSDNIAKKIGNSPLRICSNEGTSISFKIMYREAEEVCIESEDSSASIETFEGQNRNEIREFKRPIDFCQVLIVDDYESSRAVLARILERETFKYLEARDGQQAVEIVADCDRRQKPLELVIMDIDMPVMDGWDATAAIFEMYERGDILNKPYIVAYSAYTAPEFIEKATQLGMISYIKKPARERDIARIVKNLINRDK